MSGGQMMYGEGGLAAAEVGWGRAAVGRSVATGGRTWLAPSGIEVALPNTQVAGPCR